MAAPAVDIYSGSWDTGYRCDRQEVDLDGRWRIVLKDDDTATTTLNAFIEGTGAPRVASWGYGKFVQQPKGQNETFDISWWQTQFVLAGRDLTDTISNFDCDPDPEVGDLQQLTLEGTAD